MLRAHLNKAIDGGNCVLTLPLSVISKSRRIPKTPFKETWTDETICHQQEHPSHFTSCDQIGRLMRSSLWRLACFPCHRSGKLQTHEAILESEQQDMVISRRLDFDKAGQFQIELKNGPAVAQLGLERLLLGFPVSDWVSINAQGQDALSAQDFIGASGALAYHGTPLAPESQSPRWNAHVYPAGDGIKVRVERLPYYSCHYVANYGDNTQMSLTMPPGSTCPNVPSHSFVAATPGQDDTAIKEWWFGIRNN
jgi:hypothetical protein